MKSAVFERQQGNLEVGLNTVDTAITKFPKFAKLHMIRGQILSDMLDISGARASYAAGMKACPKEPTLWILASRLEEKAGKAIKSRALLEKARIVNPKNEDLWSEAVAVEERNSGVQQAKVILARGVYCLLFDHLGC
jgi:pre-mRNA-processing factor 6